jgi:hypothetical protein
MNRSNWKASLNRRSSLTSNGGLKRRTVPGFATGSGRKGQSASRQVSPAITLTVCAASLPIGPFATLTEGIRSGEGIARSTGETA